MASEQRNNNSLEVKVDSSSTILEDTIIDSTYFGIPDQANIPYRSVEKSVETTAQTERIDYVPKERLETVQSWQTITLVFTLFLVGFVRAFNTNRTMQSVRALFNYVVAQEIVREEKVFFHRSNLVLTLVHMLNTGLLIHYIINHLGKAMEIGGIHLFTILVAMVALTYLLKYLFSQFLFFILDASNLAIEYIFTTCLYNNLLGVILLPIMSVAFFTNLGGVDLIHYIALPLVGLIFALRLFRLTVIGNANGVSYLYIFLYICTLEILPLVVLYRIFILE